jgi:hypothetical protein
MMAVDSRNREFHWIPAAAMASRGNDAELSKAVEKVNIFFAGMAGG